MDAKPEPLTINVVSDVVCPWCYLGKRRLEAAIRESGEAPVTVRWRPFQLDPSLPPGGVERKAYMRAKFRDEAQLKAIHERLTAMGAEVGAAYAFDKIEWAPNTLDAHRLIRWAQAGDQQNALVERLFRLYFEEGQNIGDRATLIAAARECGMDGDEVAKKLATDDDIEAVKADVAEAHAVGVTGVPFFIFASRFAVPGAQATETLVEAIAQARAAKTGVETV
ncbi:MAG: DsbA family oxidoreductase [Bradyrhizobium sp.]|nr:MAG: DsbA family oxidoreductase [Bradyrhizobium sp.]